MTEASLIKRRDYFLSRMVATKDNQDTPQGKRAYTMAQNCWRRTQRQLLCLQATGSIAGWVGFKI